MDAGICDTLNRRTAESIAKHLDLTDFLWGVPSRPIAAWYEGDLANAFMADEGISNSALAWLLGALAAKAGLSDHAELIPADCDWDNLFMHFRAAITARRNPESPHSGAAEICPAGVV